ncbi:MAG: hypothetical protein ACOYLB_17480, partial [Phototrophicaceae bacterium]
EISPNQPYQYQADLQFLGGNSLGGGIMFNTQNAQTRQQSHMIRFNADGQDLYAIFGYFSDDSDFQGQGSAKLSFSPQDSQAHRLGVRVEADTYAVLVDGQSVATDIPVIYRGGSVGLITSSSQVAFDNVLVESLTPEQVVENPSLLATPSVAPAETLLVDDAFDGVAGTQPLWVPVNGEWVLDEAGFTQKIVEGFDFSAGYLTELPSMDVEATFTHTSGQGGGVLFHMNSPDQITQSHMVRYAHDANIIMYGYFDANGVFNGQGSVDVPAPQTAPQQLRVRADDASYSVELNGELLVRDVPVMTSGSYAGLVTSQSTVTFDSFRVRGGDVPPPASVETVASFSTVNGEWTFDQVISQSAQEPTDYVAGTGIQAQKFTASVNITLPADPADAGGGLLFNMGERDSIATSQMVRFSQGGKEIFWGTFDANRAFVGQGGAILDLDWAQPHQLSVQVKESTFDVLVDAVPIQTDIPLQYPSGWIGLVSFRGVVQFDQFTVSSN